MCFPFKGCCRRFHIFIWGHICILVCLDFTISPCLLHCPSSLGGSICRGALCACQHLYIFERFKLNCECWLSRGGVSARDFFGAVSWPCFYIFDVQN